MKNNIFSLVALLATFFFVPAGFANSPSSIGLAATRTAATITLPAPLADGEALYLAFGTEDAGLHLTNWESFRLIATGDGNSDQRVFNLPLTEAIIDKGVYLRALVLPPTIRLFLKANDTETYINLNETPAFDRSYELTLRYDSLPSSIFMNFAYGGVYRISNSVVGGFQLWLSMNTISFYESPDKNAGNADLATLTEKSPISIRFDLQSGEQKVFTKQDGETEYRLAATLSLNEIPYCSDIGLYLFSRKDGDSFGNSATPAAIANYRVTDLATGAVIKDLVPANVGGFSMMVDAANDNAPYPAAAGSFTIPGDAIADSSSEAVYVSPLTISKANTKRIKVSMPSALIERGTLVLGYGTQDGGSVTTNSWSHTTTYPTPINADGGTFVFNSAELNIHEGDLARAFILPYDKYSTLENAKPYNASSFISVGTSAFDRQYDMRICYSASASAYFGGLNSGKTQIVQLYNDSTKRKLQVWLGDNNTYDLITNPTVGQYYDIRFVFRNGSQLTYWKRAEDTEYTSGPTASLTSIYTGELYFLARKYSDIMGSTEHRFQHFTATDLTTGETLIDLRPVNFGGQNFIYDLAANSRLANSSSFIYSNQVIADLFVPGTTSAFASALTTVTAAYTIFYLQ